MDMKTRVISFFCDVDNSTYYSEKAIEFNNKCCSLNIIHEVNQIESQGNWMLNCLSKPKFIITKLEQYKSPLIWMDIDTIIKQSFKDFDDCDCDVGFIRATDEMISIKASPIYFNYTKNSIELINDWINICEKAKINNTVELDHDALRYSVLPKHKDKLKIKTLSEQYFRQYLLNIEAPYSIKPNYIYNQIAETNKNRIPL